MILLVVLPFLIAKFNYYGILHRLIFEEIFVWRFYFKFYVKFLFITKAWFQVPKDCIYQEWNPYMFYEVRFYDMM